MTRPALERIATSHGMISVRELASAAEEVQKTKEKLRNRTKWLFASVGLLVVLIVSNFLGAVIGYMAMQEVHVNKAGANLVDGEGDVVGTREALVSLPLITAPVLPFAQLRAVKEVTVGYDDPSHGARVMTTYRVSSVTRVNDTVVTFTMMNKDTTLYIFNGQAYVVEPDLGSPDLEEADDDMNATGAPMRYLPVCVSDVSCSSFKADAADANTLMQLAADALVSIGVVQNSKRNLQAQDNIDVVLAGMNDIQFSSGDNNAEDRSAVVA